jgi:AraC-like DNA-binding protein
MLASPLLIRCFHPRLPLEAAEPTLLREVGISPELLQNPYRLVDGRVVTLAVRAIRERSGDAALALRAGESALAHGLGVPGLLMLHAQTLQCALSQLQRYWPIFCSRGGCAIAQCGELATVELAVPNPIEGVRTAHEFVFSLLVALIRRFVGPDGHPEYVAFPYARPCYSEAYAQTFQCELRFDAGAGVLAFPHSWLERARGAFDDILAQSLETAAETLLARAARDRPMHERVRALLRSNPHLLDGGHNSIANFLGVSARALRRGLQDEDRTLPMISDGLRMERAQYLLSQTDLTITQIANQLGYSVPSAFHRAFKRWTGESPERYRRSKAEHDGRRS